MSEPAKAYRDWADQGDMENVTPRDAFMAGWQRGIERGEDIQSTLDYEGWMDLRAKLVQSERLIGELKEVCTGTLRYLLGPDHAHHHKTEHKTDCLVCELRTAIARAERREGP